ncbi:MAG: glycosyltransferase family A protein [Cyanobacteria bacterium P01_C01_bin.38]
MPKISVIIPAYNAMNYLPDTLDNLLKQTYSDFEIIIVNDGSSDSIKQWFSQFKDPRLKLINQENQGAGIARNTGITNAEGEYLAFLDADDIWESTKLEKQASILEENPQVGLVYSWVEYISETGQSTGRIVKHQAEGNVWEKLILRNLVECGSVAMVRRSCFDDVGIFDKNLSSFVEDWDMWLRIAERFPFKVIEEVLVYYRQHPNGGSKNWQAMEENYKVVIEKSFSSAPKELEYLKNKSYSSAYLCLAWKPLQSRIQDYEKAIYFRNLAIKHYPQIRFTKEFFRLCLAIEIQRWLGNEGYQKFLKFFFLLRRCTTAIIK